MSEERAPVIPGEVLVADDAVEIHPGREVTTLHVENTGDRPVQVGSHLHLAEANAALEKAHALAPKNLQAVATSPRGTEFLDAATAARSREAKPKRRPRGRRRQAQAIAPSAAMLLSLHSC